MRKVSVFDSISADGYFVDRDGEMSWAYQGANDPEWGAFVSGNAGGGGALLFGRITYEMMAGYWPTPAAAAAMPAVAAGMNAMPKMVASRTLRKPSWQNTTVLKGDLTDAVRTLKKGRGEDVVILGSGSIVAQLSEVGLIDSYQLVVNPVVLGSGRTLFEGMTHPILLKLTASRTFRNGKVVLTYEPA